ncbi:MAG: hypothetical protein ACFFDC_16195, partial [Promethearchaeota archaeon]
IDSSMSYYTVNSYFSQFEKDWIQSLIVQRLLFDLVSEYETLGRSYDLVSPEAVMNTNQDTIETLTQAWIYFKRMNFPLAFTQAKEAAVYVDTLTVLLNQMGVEKDNPLFIFPEPMIEDLGETSEISSTTLPQSSSESDESSTFPSSTQREGTPTISTFLTTQISQTSVSTSLSMIGFFIAISIQIYYKKKGREMR